MVRESGHGGHGGHGGNDVGGSGHGWVDNDDNAEGLVGSRVAKNGSLKLVTPGCLASAASRFSMDKQTDAEGSVG